MRVDDYGCFFADTRILKGELFILKLNSVREADITRWMVECHKAGLIVLYESVGKKYLQILDFRQRLDRAKSKFPLPTKNPAVVNELQPEVEVEYEVEREIPREEINEVLYTIEHCLTVALNDARWVKANKATEKELQDFNSLLEKRAVYQKNPADYKQHFANWKDGGKKDLKETQNKDAVENFKKTVAAAQRS